MLHEDYRKILHFARPRLPECPGRPFDRNGVQIICQRDFLLYTRQEIMTKFHINKLIYRSLCQNFSISLDFLAYLLRLVRKGYRESCHTKIPFCLQPLHRPTLAEPDSGSVQTKIPGTGCTKDAEEEREQIAHSEFSAPQKTLQGVAEKDENLEKF